MVFETSETVTKPSQSHAISRRALVRTGVTAAWSVPLIQVVAAGAAAASGGTLAMSVSGTQNSWQITGGSGNDRIHTLKLTATAENTGTATTTELTITFTFPTGWSPTVSQAPTGWSAGATQPLGTGRNSWIFTATNQVGTSKQSSDPCAVTFQFVAPNGLKQGSVTLTTNAKSGANLTGSNSGVIPLSR